MGARTEFQFTPTPPRNGTEADAILDGELEHLIHLGLLNRGVMITPFHNMMLVCPQTTAADVEPAAGVRWTKCSARLWPGRRCVGHAHAVNASRL